jgi:putative endonuclease
LLYAAAMQKDHHYYVYILSSRSRTLYVGVTNDLLRRVEEHREGTYDSFTAKYKIHRLVYFEHFQYVRSAIQREKEIKGWLRAKKIVLIESGNATWEDFYPGMVGQG